MLQCFSPREDEQIQCMCIVEFGISKLCTCKNGSAFPLILWTAPHFAFFSERRLKHEAGHVVILLKLRLSYFQFGLLKVRCHMRHLDVRYLGVQFADVDRHGIHYHLDVFRSELFTVQAQ